jgi:hypothetical protein
MTGYIYMAIFIAGIIVGVLFDEWHNRSAH